MGVRVTIPMLVLLLGSVSACYEGATQPFPEPDFDYFVAEAYPVILRDCGFTTCHANPTRAFNIYAPGRLRLDPQTPISDEELPEELEASYDHARAMLLTGEDDIRHATLLRKPREGSGHAGLDGHGNNVYGHPDEPGYVTLLEWALGATL